MTDSMTCTYCGRTKQYPDGFPVRHFAQCWDCAWDDHIHTSHPRIVRRIKRVAKKRAKALSTRQTFDALFEREKRQVLGVVPPPPPRPDPLPDPVERTVRRKRR